MKVHTLEYAQILPIQVEQAWEFFSTPRNLDEITPDDMGLETTCVDDDRLYPGQIITHRISPIPGLRFSWITEIKHIEHGRSFVDEQRFGPFRFWHHRHTFEPAGDGVRIGDLVHYALPFGPFGTIAHAVFVRRKLESIFTHREKILSARFGGQD